MWRFDVSVGLLITIHSWLGLSLESPCQNLTGRWLDWRLWWSDDWLTAGCCLRWKEEKDAGWHVCDWRDALSEECDTNQSESFRQIILSFCSREITTTQTPPRLPSFSVPAEYSDDWSCLRYYWLYYRLHNKWLFSLLKHSQASLINTKNLLGANHFSS